MSTLSDTCIILDFNQSDLLNLCLVSDKFPNAPDKLKGDSWLTFDLIFVCWDSLIIGISSESCSCCKIVSLNSWCWISQEFINSFTGWSKFLPSSVSFDGRFEYERHNPILWNLSNVSFLASPLLKIHTLMKALQFISLFLVYSNVATALIIDGIQPKIYIIINHHGYKIKHWLSICWAFQFTKLE